MEVSDSTNPQKIGRKREKERETVDCNRLRVNKTEATAVEQLVAITPPHLLRRLRTVVHPCPKCTPLQCSPPPPHLKARQECG